jgi:NAD dependent epimerase/dehydratase family enzyme
MTLPFALNYFGNGMQFMPWVHIKDLLSIFTFFVENEKTQGIYNVNHPQVLNNKEFTTTIAQLKKPLSPLLPIPSFMLKIIMGESASLVLDGQLVNSQKLINAGYKFQFENLKTALQDIFNKK